MILIFWSPNGTENKFVQEQISSQDSFPHSISTEETSISSENGTLDLIPEMMTASPTPPQVARTCKSTKAGESASQDAINLWKENGFSR